jgi:hypothetical protein
MRKLREILQHQYIGAITIGFILAQAVTTIVGVVVQCGAYSWEIQHWAGRYDRKPNFPWETLAISLVSGVLYLIPAYLLIRWLYYEREVVDGTEAEQDQDDLTDSLE